MSKRCPGHCRDNLGTFVDTSEPGARRGRRHPVGHSLAHPRFQKRSRGHSPDTWGLKGPRYFRGWSVRNTTKLSTSESGFLEDENLNFVGAPGYPSKNRDIPPKVWFPWVSKDIPNFLAPTPSCGRPPPHPKISGPKSLGSGSFFFPDFLVHQSCSLCLFYPLSEDGNCLPTPYLVSPPSHYYTSQPQTFNERRWPVPHDAIERKENITSSVTHGSGFEFLESGTFEGVGR